MTDTKHEEPNDPTPAVRVELGPHPPMKIHESYLRVLEAQAREDADPSGCVSVDSDDLIELISAYRERDELCAKLAADLHHDGGVELDEAIASGLGAVVAKTIEHHGWHHDNIDAWLLAQMPDIIERVRQQLLAHERDELRQRIEHAESALVRISDLCISGLQAPKEKRT